jgi:N-acetylmuramoyl-L-alanine amidase
VLLLTALLVVAGMAPVVAQQSDDANVFTGSVAAGITLNVRSGPGLAHPAFTTLAGGQRVELIGHDNTGAWIQVRLDDDRIGWASSQFLLSDVPFDTLPIAGVAPDVPAVAAPAAAPAPGVGGLATGTVVNAALLNVRTGPGLNFGLFDTLTLSQTVTLEGRDANGAWLQARLPDNRLGWVSSAFISPNLQIATLPVASQTVAPVTPTVSASGFGGLAIGAVVNATLLNVRNGPGLNFTILDTLPLSRTVVLEGRNAAGSWLQVRLPDGRLGWVSGAFMNANLDVANLPVTG